MVGTTSEPSRQRIGARKAFTKFLHFFYGAVTTLAAD